MVAVVRYTTIQLHLQKQFSMYGTFKIWKLNLTTPFCVQSLPRNGSTCPATSDLKKNVVAYNYVIIYFYTDLVIVPSMSETTILSK